MNAYLRALRLERWPRSLAIYSGVAAFFFLRRQAFFSFSLAGLIGRAAGAFLLTWTISTANYVINEIADRPFDAHHPTKSRRPLVLGEIRQGPFASIGIALTVIGLGAAALLFSRSFLFSLAGLFAAGIVYNVKPVRSKDIPFLDSISESVNNPIRFLIGWFAFAPPDLLPPVALLLSWWAFGNFLMVAKRLSEFRFLKEKASDYRTSHKRYTKTSLLAGMILSAAACLAGFLYFAAVFRLESFFAIAPFLLVFILLIFRKTLNEAEVMEEPEKLLANSRYAVYVFFLLALFIVAFFKDSIGR